MEKLTDQRDPGNMAFVNLSFLKDCEGYKWLIVDPVTGEHIRLKNIEIFYATDLKNSQEGILEIPCPALNIRGFKEKVEWWRAHGEP